MARFWCGVTRPNTVRPVERPRPARPGRRGAGGRRRVVRRRDADPPGDRADGARVVARDHLEPRRPGPRSSAACRRRRGGPAPRRSPAPPAARPCGSVAVERRVGAGQRAAPAARCRRARPPAPEPRVGSPQPASTISGAPSTQVPAARRRSRALHLRAEENGTDCRARPAAGGGKAAASAPQGGVGVRVVGRARRARRRSRSASCPSSGSQRGEAMAPSVRVPVLSRHTTSTRARPSTAGQLLDQHLAAGPGQGADDEGDAGQQDEALGHHADQRRRPCRRWRRTRSRPGAQLADEQDRADRGSAPR